MRHQCRVQQLLSLSLMRLLGLVRQINIARYEVVGVIISNVQPLSTFDQGQSLTPPAAE